MKFLLALILSLNTSFCIPINIFDISDNNQTEIIQEIEDSNTIDNNEYSARAVKPSSRSSGTNTNNVPTFTTPNEYDTYLEAYYSELQYNFGENKFGTCGYVAIEMLLSYYDTFLNNQIIPQQYNEIAFNRNMSLDGEYIDGLPVPINQKNMIIRHNSPGTKNDYLLENQISNYYDNNQTNIDMNKYEYYLQELEEYTDQYFHLKLIELGNHITKTENGVTNTYNYNQYTPEDLNIEGFYNPKYLPGLTSDESIDVLTDYLNSNTTTANKFTITSCTSQNEIDIKNFIKAQIDLGKPVVASIKVFVQGKVQDHAVVCYTYDDNYIYCNTGWRYQGIFDIDNYEYSRLAIGTDIPETENVEKLFLDAFVIDFNLPVAKASAYPVYSTTTNYTLYPYDSCYILTYKELPHSHSGVFVEFTADGHYDSCAFCGTKLFHSTHSYIVDGYSFICNEHGHQYNCAVCSGFPICEEHDFMPNYVEYRDDGHYGVCLTSRQLVWMSEHNYEYAYTSGGYDYFYCECGRNYSTPTG